MNCKMIDQIRRVVRLSLTRDDKDANETLYLSDVTRITSQKKTEVTEKRQLNH